MKKLSLYEIDQKIADLCKSYSNKKISRIQFDDNYKLLNKQRDAIAAKKLYNEIARSI